MPVDLLNINADRQGRLLRSCLFWAPDRESIEERITAMLWTIVVVLVILWLLGLVSSYTMGGFIHILLVIAIVVVLVRVIRGQKPI